MFASPLRVAVGPSDPVARYLELGVGVYGPYPPGHDKVHIRPRSHLVPPLSTHQVQLARMICRPI